MRRVLRWIGRGALVLLVLALAGIGGGVLYLRSDRGERLLRSQIESAVTSAGGRLTAGQVRMRSLRRIELDDVQLSFARQSTIRVRHVEITWAPIALVWGEVRVSTLALVEPQVRLVQRDGTWGFPDDAGGDPGPRIRLARVSVVDGRVAVGLEDGDEPTRIVLRSVHGEAGVTIGWLRTTIDVRELHTRLAGRHGPALALRGGVSDRRHETRIDAQVATETSTLALALTMEQSGRLHLTATTPGLAVADLRRLVPSWNPPAAVAATITAAGPLAALETTASIDVGPAIAVRATGTVDAETWPPQVDVALEGSHVEVDRVGRIEAGTVRVRGGGEPLAATVEGALVVADGRVAVDGRVTTDAEGALDASATFVVDDVDPWLGFRGAVRGVARLAGGRVHVDVTSATTAQVVASGTAAMTLDAGSAEVDLHVAAVDTPERAGRIGARIAGLGGTWGADVVLEAGDPVAGTLRATARVEPAATGVLARVAALAVGRRTAAEWRLARPASIRWDGAAISADELTLVRGDGRLRLRGRVRPTGAEDALDLAIVAENVDVADIDDWIPAGIESMAGRLDAEVTVRGPFAGPTFDGGGTLVASSARVVGIGQLEDLRIRVRGRSGDMLVIESLEARAGKGEISGDGSIGLAAAGEAPIAAQLRLRRVPIARRPLYSGVLAGRVTVDGTVEAPRLHADLRIPRGVIRPRLLPEEGANLGTDPTITVVGEEVPEPPPSAAEALGPVTIDATLALGDDVYIRRKDAEIRLGGTLAIDKPRDAPFRVSGPIDLASGWYVFKGRRFDVRSGTVRFTGQPAPDPELQIRARYRAPGYVVWVDVGGIVSAPTLAFSSEPSLSEADVLAVLLFGRPASELRGEQQGVVRQEAQSVAFSYVAPALEASARKVLPVDRIEVSGTEVLVARQVTQDVFISLAQDLTERGGQTVGMEYDLTPRTSVKLSTSSRGSSAIDLFWRRRY